MYEKQEFAAGEHPFEIVRLCRYFSEQSPLPRIAVEGETHIVRYLNPAFSRLVGKDRSELIGRPFAEAARKLHLHDCPAFRRDFRLLLSRREKFTLARREAVYCLRLLLHQSVKTDLAVRLKIPAIIARLRDAAGTFTNNPAGAGSRLVGDD